MKIHRFFYPGEIPDTNVATITDRDLVHQITRVLKLTIGETLELVTGTGTDVRGTIEKLTKTQATIAILEKRANCVDPKKKLHLHLAILKRENFELAIAKAVECGVTDITPIVTKRTVKTGLNYERLNRILIEATEQSGRNKIPALHKQEDFEKSLESAKTHALACLCHFGGKKLSELAQRADTQSVALYIGPEGGFTAEEIALAKEKELELLSLGDRVLRAETAAIVATYHFGNTF